MRQIQATQIAQSVFERLVKRTDAPIGAQTLCRKQVFADSGALSGAFKRKEAGVRTGMGEVQGADADTGAEFEYAIRFEARGQPKKQAAFGGRA